MFDFCPICGTDEVITSLEEHIISHLRLLAPKSLPAYEDEGSDLSEDDRSSASASKPASRTTIKDDPERRFEWGFLTEAGDAQLESHENDVVIQSMIANALATVDQTKITPSRLEDDDLTGGSRSQHEVVFCGLYNDHPEGFRDNLGLYRHIEGNHQVLINRYICVDPSASGVHSKVSQIVPLDTCAACNQEYRYLREPDAFAHLRATHFLNVNPQPTDPYLQRWCKVIIRNHRRYAADPEGAVKELMELASEKGDAPALATEIDESNLEEKARHSSVGSPSVKLIDSPTETPVLDIPSRSSAPALTRPYRNLSLLAIFNTLDKDASLHVWT
ncbi:hypothetical protein EDB80DRAFT_864237 [Ilyonectria destructans]|nr:hypothetical protein EDB80DRAFT_864237 [Ilyonectria destructans]